MDKNEIQEILEQHQLWLNNNGGKRADLRGVEGSFIGYKKVRGHIVKLEILSDAKRSSATTRKCRCSAAKVLSITTLDGRADGTQFVSSGRDSDFVYRVGEIVRVDDFDENRWNECSTGVHFFITRDEAVEYNVY